MAALVSAVTVVSVLAGGGIISGVTAQSTVTCTATPTTVTPGEPVTLDASNSSADFVEFDTDGDGAYDRTDETDFVVEVTYENPGTYEPVVRADGNDNVTASCGEVTVSESNDPPTASFAVDTQPATVGESANFDAGGSNDSDGTVTEYRWDFDGDGELELTGQNPVVEHTFDEAGEYTTTLTVVDDDGATNSTSSDVVVESGTEEDDQTDESSVNETEDTASPENTTSSWPQKGDDPRNTGYDASALAPTANPSEAWATENIDRLDRSSPVVVEGTVYIGTAGAGGRPFFYAFDAESGSIDWFFEAEDAANKFDTTPVVADGRVYAGTEDGRMYIRDAETGDSAGDQFPLRFTSGQAEISVETPTVADGTLYFGTGDGKVHAYDASNGAVQWTFELEGGSTEVADAPAVADGTVYFATSGLNTQRIYAVNADAGSVEWQYTLGDTGSSPGGATQVTVNDGQAYVGAEDLDSNAPNRGEDVYAFDAETGDVVWTKSLDGEYVGSGKTGVAAAGQGVFVAAQPGTVYALDADSGETVWETSTAGEITVQPSIANQVLYVGDNSGQVYAFNTSTGEQKWGVLASQGGIAASPTPAGGALYVPTSDNGLIKYTGDVADQRSKAIIDVEPDTSASADGGDDGTPGGDDESTDDQAADESTDTADGEDGGDDGASDEASTSDGDDGDDGDEDINVEVNNENDNSVEIPGMGVRSAIVGILVALYLARYRS